MIINTLPHSKEDQIVYEIVAALTHELFGELVKIDERREHSIDILGEEKSELKIKHCDIQDFEIL